MRLKLSGTDRKAVGHGSSACLSALTHWPCPVASGPHSPLWLQPHACLRSPKQDVSMKCCAFLGLYAARPQPQSEHVQMSICPQPGPGRMDQTPAVRGEDPAASSQSQPSPQGGSLSCEPLSSGKEVPLVCSCPPLWFIGRFTDKSQNLPLFPHLGSKRRRKVYSFPLPPCCCEILEGGA